MPEAIKPDEVATCEKVTHGASISAKYGRKARLALEFRGEAPLWRELERRRATRCESRGGGARGGDERLSERCNCSAMAPKKKNRNLDAWEAEMNALDENGIVQDAGENTVPGAWRVLNAHKRRLCNAALLETILWRLW